MLWKSCICQDASCQLLADLESPAQDQGLTGPLCLCDGDNVAVSLFDNMQKVNKGAVEKEAEQHFRAMC